jgi:ribulose-5-phosphate 4-epimerase/fuculose-1-phosphate aldolase
MSTDTATAAMSAALREQLDELARACRILEMEGHGDRVFGHMALRDPDGRGFWMKRAGVALGEIHDARDFVLLSMEGKKLAGAGRSHGEWPIHSEIFKARADVNASAHTHPFYASVYTACEDPLPIVVPRSANQPPTPPRWEDTSDLITRPEQGRSMAAAMGPHYCVLLRNHGIVTCGPTIKDPVIVAIALEKMCREALTIHGSGMRFGYPDSDELAIKRTSGAGLDATVAGGGALWSYYLRKLARVEAGGDPLIATRPVPIAKR